MSRASVLARGRAFAAGGFVDSCTIERVVGKTVGPGNDGTVTVQTELIYTGPCRFQQGAAPWAGPATVGQAGIGLSAQELQLPTVGSEGVAKDDIVTCTTATHDTELVGRTWTVQGSHHATHKTMRRLPLAEVLG